ncbi:hypothetical protein GY45DRAFT_1250302 [Cubamyces sp. BRFM 1775]|nr:hypothetical protein GY45DRAFT_1250302 [Cubamyces sp. BRFM 1775]
MHLNGQQSAVQRCLRISEISGEICEILCVSGHGLAALARLAQTCKFLHETAVPVLWRQMRGLKPLLKLFPEGTWTEEHTGFRFTNPAALDWTRFQHYAHSVRCLVWRQDHTDIPIETLAALSLHRPRSEPLLPQLCSLMWHDSREDYAAFIHMFLTPSIREMRINTVLLDPAATAALFEHARHACNNVEVLELHAGISRTLRPLHPVADDALAKYLRSLTSLQEYHGVIILSAKCVEALGTRPNLRLVQELYALPEELEAATAAATSLLATGEWFKSVELLVLRLSRFSASSQAFLATIQSPTVSEVFISVVHGPADTSTLQEHMQVFTSAPFRHSLRTVRVEFGYDLIWYDDPAYLSVMHARTVLRPLLDLQQLDTLIFRTPRWDLDPATLRDISDAWPMLKTFSVAGGFRICEHEESKTNGQCVTLLDLVPLARKCPDLLSLELHLCALEVPTIDDAEVQHLLGPGPSRCGLDALRVFHGPIRLEDADAVAKFLKRLFPKLQRVDYGSCVEEDEEDEDDDVLDLPLRTGYHESAGWEEVQRLLQDYQMPAQATGQT